MDTLLAIVLTVALLITVLYVFVYSVSHKKYKNRELFNDNKNVDCMLYEINQKKIAEGAPVAIARYQLAAKAFIHKHTLKLSMGDDLTREQLEQLPEYNEMRKSFFPGDTNLGITAFNDMLRRSFDHDTGRLLGDEIRSHLQNLDNQCDTIPIICRTETEIAACQAITEMIDTTMESIRQLSNASTNNNATTNANINTTSKDNEVILPDNELDGAPRATSTDINGVPPAEEINPDITADGTEVKLAANRANVNDPRTDPLFGVGDGPQSPPMVAGGRADETDPALNRDAQRMYKFVLDKISALYRDSDNGGNFSTGLTPDLYNAIDGLSEGQRAALCAAYCGQFTPCGELCRYMGCINCIVGNTPVDRQNPGNTGGGIGDPQIDMRGMVLPGSARITDDYILLDSKVIKYQAVPRGDGNDDVSRQGFLKGLIGMGDDMKGVVNVFAPTVHIHPNSQTV